MTPADIEAIRAALRAEARLAAIARGRRPAASETAEAVGAYKRAAEVQRRYPTREMDAVSRVLRRESEPCKK